MAWELTWFILPHNYSIQVWAKLATLKCAIYVHNDLPICYYLVFAQVELDPEKQLK